MTTENTNFDQETIQTANWLFSGNCDFIAGATKVSQLPDFDVPEVAFCGLSNVGKSTLINTLTNRKSLARTSQTPGRTKQINFFSLRNGLLTLVDLPGYGYAKASKQEIGSWNKLIDHYLKGRPNLMRVLMLIDARRGVKETNLSVMKQLDEAAVSYQLILTKCDEVKKSELDGIIESCREKTQHAIALHPEIIATSSKNAINIEQLRCQLLQFALHTS